MHILHCLTHSTFGGGQAVPFLLMKNLLQHRPEFRHTVMAPPGGVYVERCRSIGIDVVEFPLNRFLPGHFTRIASIVRHLNPDVIHTHGRGAGIYIRSLPRSVIHAGRVHTHHGFHIPVSALRKISFRVLEKLLNRNTDLHIAVSVSEKEEILTAVSPKNPVTVIANIVDPVQVRQDALAEIAETVPFDRFTVAVIGRNDPVKNFPLAVTTAEWVLRHTDAIRFLFIGLQPDQPVISTLIRKYPENVHATGALHNPLPLLLKSSVLLITSKREGSPLSVLEALSLGKPVIGTDVRGIRDTVQHGKTGFLSDGSAEEMGKNIIEMLNNPRRYEQISGNALSFIEQQCDVRNWCEQYATAYNSLSTSC